MDMHAVNHHSGIGPAASAASTLTLPPVAAPQEPMTLATHRPERTTVVSDSVSVNTADLHR